MFPLYDDDHSNPSSQAPRGASSAQAAAASAATASSPSTAAMVLSKGADKEGRPKIKYGAPWKAPAPHPVFSTSTAASAAAGSRGDYISLMDTAQREITLETELDADPTQFLMYAQDKNIEHQAFIQDCLTHDVLRQVGNTYLNGDEAIGDSLEEAVLYLKDKKNSSVYTTLKARLKSFS